jgi:choloylglycine hydrolase
MCTSLVYRDGSGNSYLGRTLELDVEEAYAVTYVPAGTPFSSQVEGHEPFEYKAKHPFLAVAAPVRMPSKEQPLGPQDLKVVEGMNVEGVTCSLLAYPTSGGAEEARKVTQSLLQAVDIGTWVLGTFANVEELKEGLDEQGIFLTRLAMVGNLPFPFHVVVHDKGGKSVVIEWLAGKLTVNDNPVGVMTNGPDFQWHLTNLGNWTHLTNVDVSNNKFGDLEVRQPDSGIATASLPGSNTSVGRFIRAVFYSEFTEKTDDPELALLALARIMNNFDRPRGATVDPRSGAEGISFQGKNRNEGAPPTEYTSWTNLSDMSRGRFLLRTYDSYGYTSFDLKELAKRDELLVSLTSKLDPYGGDGTGTMVSPATFA